MEDLFCPKCKRIKTRCTCTTKKEKRTSNKSVRKSTVKPEFYKQSVRVDEKYSIPHFYIGPYVPKYRRVADDFSDLIEWFKSISRYPEKVKRDLVDYFAGELAKIANKNSIRPDAIVPIPSHKAGEISEGLRRLSKELSKRLDAEDYTGALIRTVDVRKSSWSSYQERPSFGEHYDSLKVAGNVSGKIVLLVDDVYTLGNTSRAAAKRLFEAGAKDVCLFTLAKTVRIDDDGETK